MKASLIFLVALATLSVSQQIHRPSKARFQSSPWRHYNLFRPSSYFNYFPFYERPAAEDDIPFHYYIRNTFPYGPANYYMEDYPKDDPFVESSLLTSDEIESRRPASIDDPLSGRFFFNGLIASALGSLLDATSGTTTRTARLTVTSYVTSSTPSVSNVPCLPSSLFVAGGSDVTCRRRRRQDAMVLDRLISYQQEIQPSAVAPEVQGMRQDRQSFFNPTEVLSSQDEGEVRDKRFLSGRLVTTTVVTLFALDVKTATTTLSTFAGDGVVSVLPCRPESIELCSA